MAGCWRTTRLRTDPGHKEIAFDYAFLLWALQMQVF
jgi:hypothetical protein